MSPLSEQYVIPQNQSESKRYAILLFNSHQRPGAVSEAENFESALEMAGFHVVKIEWGHTTELPHMIDGTLERILSDCCLLVCCVMSHGLRGVLKGSNSSEIPINTIIQQFMHALPENIPFVSKKYSSSAMMFCLNSIYTVCHPFLPTSHWQEPMPQCYDLVMCNKLCLHSYVNLKLRKIMLFSLWIRMSLCVASFPAECSFAFDHYSSHTHMPCSVLAGDGDTGLSAAADTWCGTCYCCHNCC